MLHCANCQKGLPDGTMFCDYCGNELLGVAPLPTPDTPRDPAPRVASRSANDTSRRPSIAVAPSKRAAQARVDSESDRQTPPSLSAYTPRASRPPEANALSEPVIRDPKSITDRVIQLQLGRDVFELLGQSTYLVGRRDLDQQLFPDVDLHDWSGAEAGVSRRHIIIRVIGNIVSIEDLESRNSTILNGYRLFPHQQYPLVDSDEIRLGDLTLLVRIIVTG